MSQKVFLLICTIVSQPAESPRPRMGQDWESAGPGLETQSEMTPINSSFKIYFKHSSSGIWNS